MKQTFLSSIDWQIHLPKVIAGILALVTLLLAFFASGISWAGGTSIRLETWTSL